MAELSASLTVISFFEESLDANRVAEGTDSFEEEAIDDSEGFKTFDGIATRVLVERARELAPRKELVARAEDRKRDIVRERRLQNLR